MLTIGPSSRWWFYDWFYVENCRSDLHLRLGEETKGLQVEYHWMGRVSVDKKIFRAPWW
jgi:hypothetical protein